MQHASTSPAPQSPSPSSSPLGASREFVIPRDGDRDLAFKGWRLSQTKECQDFSTSKMKSCTEVSICLVEIGVPTLVTHVRRWMETEGAVSAEKHAVGVHRPASEIVVAGTPGYTQLRAVSDLEQVVDQALKWLKKDNGGRLGAVSKKAWLAACRTYPELKGQEVERIE